MYNSYGGTGINFGILVAKPLKNCQLNGNSLNPEYNIALDFFQNHQNECSIIEYHTIDGCDTRTIQNMFSDWCSPDFIIFAAYSSAEIQTKRVTPANKTIITNEQFLFFHHSFVLKVDDSFKKIEEVVEDYYLENYHGYDKKRQEIAKCFLQRHRYGTQELTDTVINKCLKKTNNK